MRAHIIGRWLGVDDILRRRIHGELLTKNLHLIGRITTCLIGYGPRHKEF